MTLWQLGKKQMDSDLSYLFNKETICNFSFELEHDYKWWLNLRKKTLISVFASFCIILIIGLIICLLQIWWNQSHPVTIYTVYWFVFGGIMVWCAYGLLMCFMIVWEASFFHKTLLTLFPLFKQAVNQGYLSADVQQYPDVVKMAFYTENPATWRMNNPSSRFTIVMPVFGIVAILSQVKQYQAKYCNLNQNTDENKLPTK